MNRRINKKTHGGRRPGAGRKLFYEEKMIPATVRLPLEYLDALRDLGGGNVSQGVRWLYEEFVKVQAVQ